jgi:tRNA (guanine-N7-)-methyltransferase
LRRRQREALERLLPRLAIDLPPAGAMLDPNGLFEFPARAIWLEIGFGAGEHLLAQARAWPDVGFLSGEPYMNGVARLLTGIDAAGLRNVRVFCDDARLLLERLRPRSIERVFILFPDPWPKKRHHKRRIVSSAVLAELDRVLTSGGEIRIATDDRGYLTWILEHTLRHGAFEWLARRPDDWRRRPADWPETRYESKALREGRRCAFLRFRRRAAGTGGR